MPTAIMFERSALSPELKNGNGIPVFGISETTTPMLTSVWVQIMMEIPAAIRYPRRSFAFIATRKPIKVISIYNPMIRTQPKKPNSSAIAANMKSDSITGTYPE